jgi:hypothetical protein
MAPIRVLIRLLAVAVSLLPLSYRLSHLNVKAVLVSSLRVFCTTNLVHPSL